MEESKIYGFEMARISEVYLSTLSAIMRPYNLERHFAAFLYLCRNSGQITQNELAIALKKDKVSTMRTVDYLCERNFLERKKDETDRRCHILAVTEKALELKPLVEEAIEKTNQIILEDLTTEEQDVFRTIMIKLMKTIKNLPAPDFIVEAYEVKKDV